MFKQQKIKPKHPCTQDCPMRSATCHTSQSPCKAWHEYQEAYDKYTQESIQDSVKRNDVNSAIYYRQNKFSRTRLMDKKRGRKV